MILIPGIAQFVPIICPQCNGRLEYTKLENKGQHHLFHRVSCPDNSPRSHLTLIYQKDWLIQSAESSIGHLTLFSRFLPQNIGTYLDAYSMITDSPYSNEFECLFDKPTLIPWHLDDWSKMVSLIKTLVTFQ